MKKEAQEIRDFIELLKSDTPLPIGFNIGEAGNGEALHGLGDGGDEVKIAPQLPDFPAREFVIEKHLNKLKSNAFFSICAVDAICRRTGQSDESIHYKEAYEKLRSLHCVNYSEIPEELLAVLPTYLAFVTGLPAEEFGDFCKLGKNSGDFEAELPYFPFEDFAVSEAVRKLNEGTRFNICAVDDLRDYDCETKRTIHADAAYEKLRTLHCKEYAEMPKELLALLPAYLSCTTGVPVEKFGDFCSRNNEDSNADVVSTSVNFDSCVQSEPQLPCFDFHEFSVKKNLDSLNNKTYFDICEVSVLRAKLLESDKSEHSESALNKLELLHCIDFAEMPDELLRILPDYLSCATGLPSSAFGPFHVSNDVAEVKVDVIEDGVEKPVAVKKHGLIGAIHPLSFVYGVSSAVVVSVVLVAIGGALQRLH